MGSHRTTLAVRKYEIGERVLVTRLTATEFNPPQVATVISCQPRSMIYGYQINLPEGNRYVKDDWIIPAETVIEEVSDTPWE